MRKSSLLLLLLAIFFQELNAQENDTIEKSKTIISGYIQMDYQHFFVPDSIGSRTPYFASFSGGNFINNVTNDRFTIRRGRLKIANNGKNHKGIFSIDISEKGVGIRDLYFRYSEPFANSFSIYGGMFNRPFGQEIDLSSADRESPERSRVIQTIFPHDRDLGFMLEFQIPEDKTLHFVNLKFGIVNGNGTAIETDNYKDFIGRLGVNFEKEENDFSFKAGISIYSGAIQHIYEPVDTVSSNTATKFYIFNFESVEDSSGRTSHAFVRDEEATLATGQLGGKVDRKYLGFDGEIQFKTPFGKMIIRGEYIQGTQPSAINNKDVEQAYIIYNGIHSFSPTGSFLGVSWPMYDQPQPYNPVPVKQTQKNHHTFIRKFNGGYLYLVQELFNSPHQVVFKYDWYDPNTEVEGKEITYDDELYLNDPTYIKPYLSPADVKFETFGIGFNYFINTNLRLSLYYEHVKNEITDIPYYAGDIKIGRMPSPGFDRDIQDDVFTFRLQYSF